jgi:hypothetical protein
MLFGPFVNYEDKSFCEYGPRSLLVNQYLAFLFLKSKKKTFLKMLQETAGNLRFCLYRGWLSNLLDNFKIDNIV